MTLQGSTITRAHIANRFNAVVRSHALSLIQWHSGNHPAPAGTTLEAGQNFTNLLASNSLPSATTGGVPGNPDAAAVNAYLLTLWVNYSSIRTVRLRQFMRSDTDMSLESDSTARARLVHRYNNMLNNVASTVLGAYEAHGVKMGETISGGNFESYLNTLRGALGTNVSSTTLQWSAVFCHNSCHSACHNSRGRR